MFHFAVQSDSDTNQESDDLKECLPLHFQEHSGLQQPPADILHGHQASENDEYIVRETTKYKWILTYSGLDTK